MTALTLLIIATIPHDIPAPDPSAPIATTYYEAHTTGLHETRTSLHHRGDLIMRVRDYGDHEQVDYYIVTETFHGEVWGVYLTREQFKACQSRGR